MSRSACGAPQLQTTGHMRRGFSIGVVSALVALVAVALSGCPGPDEDHPAITVHFAPRPVSVTNLTLTRATMRLRRIAVFGNVPPPPPNMPPMDLAFDAQVTAGVD